MAPSKLIHGTDFHLFKEGIEPKWEDPKCARGGKWTFTAPKTSNRGTLDTFWLNTVRRCGPAALSRAAVPLAHAALRTRRWRHGGVLASAHAALVASAIMPACCDASAREP